MVESNFQSRLEEIQMNQRKCYEDAEEKISDCVEAFKRNLEASNCDADVGK